MATVLLIIFLTPKATLSIGVNDITANINEEFTIPISSSDKFIKIDYEIEDEDIVKYLGNDKFKAIKLGKTNIIIKATNYNNATASAICTVEVKDKRTDNNPEDSKNDNNSKPNLNENENDSPNQNENENSNSEPNNSESNEPTKPNEPTIPTNPDNQPNQNEDTSKPEFKNLFTIESVKEQNTIEGNKIFAKLNSTFYIYIIFDDVTIIPDFKFNSEEVEINKMQSVKCCYKITAKESTEIEVYNNNTYLGSILIEIIK